MSPPLKNPPVYLTLAQVRFNPILKLAEDFLPSIQESFRQSGYPDFETLPGISIQVTIKDNKHVPAPIKQDRYLFGNVEKTHIFLLDQQKLTIQSTNYGDYEHFSENFLRGLGIVNEIVQLAYTERIGLRYLDRVMPQEGDTLDQYLAPQVQGLTSKLGGSSLYTFTEAMNEVDGIKLISRVAIQEGPLSLPPDLEPLSLVFAERFVSYHGKSAFLDNDGFIEQRESFSDEKLTGSLDAIHKVLSTAFRATATDHARSIWNK